MKKSNKNRRLLPKKSPRHHNKPKQQRLTPADLLSKAIALHQEGDLKGAEQIYRSLKASYPKHPDVRMMLGTLYYHLGNLEESVRLIETAIAIDPNYAEAYYNRGLALYHLGRYTDALASYDKAIAINPNNAEAYYNRGLALFDLNRYSDAAASYDKAIAINPSHAEAYNNRGRILYDRAQYRDALVNYNKAIAINPNNAEAYWNKSLLKLLLGEYEEGWKLYEWRWKAGICRETMKLTQPLWQGEKTLAGKTIFLHLEQGLGDTIQFCRYVTMVEALGAKVILGVQSTLVALLATLKGSFNIVVPGDTLAGFDFHCPLMSLPLALGTTLDTIPANVPYLYTDHENRKSWQHRLGKKSKPRIGLVWSGTVTHVNDRNRSIPLHLLEPLLQHDFEYYSIQKDVRTADVEFLSNSKVISHTEHLYDFLDTASLVAEMDIVISVDTSVVHLAGALGKPVWVLLPFVPDFRWLLEREDSPWYPSARLFRQPTIGDWESVITKVKEELAVFPHSFKLPEMLQEQHSSNLLTKARTLHQAGNLHEAEILYRKLLAASPEHAEVLSLLGTLLVQQGNVEEGGKLMEKTIAVKPDYAEAYYNCGLVLQMLNRHSDALVNYDKAITINPYYAEAYNNRGIALHFLGQHSEAVASFDRAVAIKPDYAEAVKNRDLALSQIK